LPIPTPQAGQVLVRVRGVITCLQWDLHVHFGRPMFVGSTLTFPYTPSQLGHHGGVVEYAMQLVKEGKLNLGAVATHKMPLEAYAQAFALLKAQEALTVCFLPWS
jgi:hypothetical protein